jgi:hypothetical protein
LLAAKSETPEPHRTNDRNENALPKFAKQITDTELDKRATCRIDKEEPTDAKLRTDKPRDLPSANTCCRRLIEDPSAANCNIESRMPED